MEEEFVINQEKFKPQEEKNEVNIKLYIQLRVMSFLFDFFNIDNNSDIYY